MILVSIVVMLMSSTGQAHSGTLLPPCPSSPNCVSSMATDSHSIEALAIRGDAKACFDRLRTVLSNREDTTIISADDSHIRVEFRTFLGFVDDGLFILDVPNGRIQIRSAARLGYWDMGKNRRRIEEIRVDYSG
ncbi:MAG TPA: DUF1499 domain-containing protein [Geobacteraceae bacterium]|nr:DUF1499 domain-containing protein [Geobacteraceae bacterium]